MEYPSSDKSEATDNVVAGSELQFFTPTLDERLRSDEAFLKQAMEKLEDRRSEADQIHRAYDEQERLAALEATRRQTEQQTLQRDEKEQKLLAEIEELRNAEAEQRHRIEQANAASRWKSAEEDRFAAETECAVGSDTAEEEGHLDQLEAVRVAAEVEAEARATERQRLNAEIKNLGQVASKQIDRMDEAKSRLSLLEQVRIHAEKMVYERAEREIRLQAEIEALQRAEAAQIQRIEEAEAEAGRLAEEQTRLQEAAEAYRKMKAEARQRAAAEAHQQLENEKRLLAEEAEQRLEHLETIRAKAEAALQQRTDRESLLNSQLLAFSEAAAEQLKRIEKAEADLEKAEQSLRQLEEKAGQEEERIVELESLRNQTETRVEHRREEEQRLVAAIEDLNRIEGEQLNRIADAESTLLAHEENRQEAETGLSQKEVDGPKEVVTNDSDETPALSDDLQLETDNEETSVWSLADSGDPSVPEKVELVSEQPSGSSLVDDLETAAAPNLSVDAWMESSPSEESLEDEIELMPSTSLVDRLRTDHPAERAKAFKDLSRLDENDAFNLITGLFDDASEKIRNSAARALYNLNPSRAETFTRALREAPPERRRQIIKALDCSGLAAEAIESLAGESREKTYDAFSVLFLMAKAGEVQTLLHAIEKHSNSAVRLSVIKLLTFSNRPDIIPALRSLAVRGALPIEVRSALMESIYEISSNARERALSAA
jgi:myosin heavy subunit